MQSTMDPPPGEAPPPDPHGRPAAPTRRLHRSRNDRMIAGIAGGIAETYAVDATLVRIVLAVAAVFTAGGVLVAYGVAWLVVPEADGRVVARDLRGGFDAHRPATGLWVGIALTVAGLFALNGVWHGWPMDLLGPLTLIGLGVTVLLARDHDRRPAAPTQPAPATARATMGTTGSNDPAGPMAAATPGPAWATTNAPEPPACETAGASSWPTTPAPPVACAPSPPSRPVRRHSQLGPLTWSALLVLAGGAWLLELTDTVTVDPAAVLAIALGVVGVALVAGAWFGRSRGLIALGVVLAAACAMAASLTVPLRGGIGARVYRPATVAELRPMYRLGIGHLELDLSQLPASRGPIALQVRTGVGRIDIVVPRGAEVVVRARAGVGALGLFGDPRDGGWRQAVTVVRTASGPAAVGATITVDAEVGIGAVIVRDGSVLEEVAQ